MKKLFAIAFTVLLAASLSWTQENTAQAGKKATKTSSAESKVALNPQPLPPGAKSKPTSPADKVSLNPQPLPPKQGKTTTNSAESKVALNPQPLPPKQGKTTTSSAETTSAKKKSSAAGKKVLTPAGSTSKQ